MKSRDKNPLLAPERTDTARHKIAELLEGTPLSAREISSGAGMPEKEVLGHLPHIKRSYGGLFCITPSRCRTCGFEFKKRERFTKPGRCPLCHGGSIEPPLFYIKGR